MKSGSSHALQKRLTNDVSCMQKNLDAMSTCMQCAETWRFCLWGQLLQTMHTRTLLPAKARHFEQGHVLGLAQHACMQPLHSFNHTNYSMCSSTHAGNLKTSAEALRSQDFHSYRTLLKNTCRMTACWRAAQLFDRCTNCALDHAWTSSESIPANRTCIKAWICSIVPQVSLSCCTP